MIQIEIEKIAIDKIKPYEKNAKIHTKEQVEQIKKSIQEFGNNDPIAVDENNEIIEGHGRLIALKELGYKEVEIIRLSHLNKSQKKAYIIAHNKLTMNTGFDYDILKDELDFLDDDLQSLTGFSDFEIENILNGDDFIPNRFNICHMISDKEKVEATKGQSEVIGIKCFKALLQNSLYNDFVKNNNFKDAMIWYFKTHKESMEKIFGVVHE
jgi:hypothetical protein